MDDNNEIFYEDISSSSRPVQPTRKSTKYNAKATAENYGNGVFKHLDKVIKTISFIVSLGILLVFTAAAAILVMLDKIFAIIAVAVFAVGIVLAIIALFLIYAIGHIISQNNEIIKKL